MEKSDFLKPSNNVEVTIVGPDGSKLFQSTNTGYHSIETAVNDAVAQASLKINPEDCVFEISNLTTKVSHRYRINAHGNLKLIV